MKDRLLFLYLLVGLGDLIALLFDIQWLEWTCKPLLMITLGLYYLSSIDRLGEYFSKPVIGAIFFSLIGDVALMLQGFNENLFIVGLGAFMIAHAAYIFAYQQHRFSGEERAFLGIQKFRFSLPIVLAGTGLITILYPHLGDLKIPVIIYALVLIIMVMQALFRYGRTNDISFWFVFVGALLFMVSDSLIAINKFLHDFELAGLLIMSTYMAAQLLIIRGLVIHSSK